ACGNQSVARIAPRPSIAPIATPQPPAPKLAPPSVIAQKPVPAVEKSPAADKPPALAQYPAPPPAQPAAPAAVAPPQPTVDALPLALPATSQASIDGNLIRLTREPQFSRNQLRSSSHAVLDDVARLLSDHAEIGLVTILAPERAQGEAVAAYLRSKGVSAGRLQVSSEPALVVELRITRR